MPPAVLLVDDRNQLLVKFNRSERRPSAMNCAVAIWTQQADIFEPGYPDFSYVESLFSQDSQVMTLGKTFS